MKKRQPAGRQGFTLIEIAISVAILAIVGLLITQVLFTSTHVNTKSTLLQNIKQNGDFALDVMNRMIRGSLSYCDTGTTPSTFLLHDAQNNTVTIGCLSDGTGSLRIASVSGTRIDYLTGSNVTLPDTSGACGDTSITFTCPDAAGVPGPVTIQFSLGPLGTDLNTYATAKTSFKTTVSPRN